MSNVVSIDPKNALSFSSFGQENTTFGGGFRGRSILNGDRYADLDRKQSYYDCTQHQNKVFDFDGRVISPRSTQPLIGAEKMNTYIPMKSRRPSAPYRLGKIIVDSFTNLLFGEQRFPAIKVDGDEDSQDFDQTVARVGKLPLKMIQARSLGGSMGSVGMSWCFYKGKPRYEVHNAKNIFVHSWEDRVQLIPRHVTEVYLFYKVQWDGKQFAKIFYWFRRDWTPDWDYIFKEVPVEPNKDPFWIPDMDKSVNHNDGLNHFVWIQNRPTDEIDGLADYEGLYDQFDSLDILSSVVMRGATLNLDPTLVLMLDPDLVRAGVKKGSEQTLAVGEGGDAKYLELSGTSIESGVKLIDSFRRSILETAQAVVVDPNEVAAQGVSSVSQKAMFRPMLAQADILREQYGEGITRLLDGPSTVARKMSGSRVIITDQETGVETVGEITIELPPKIEMKPNLDPATGEKMKDPETGEDMPDEVIKTDRKPGEGGEINLVWPPYFQPTPDDQTKIVTNMQTATGGKAVISKKTATSIVAGAFGIDPAEEERRLETQGMTDKADTAAMFPPGLGGEVDDPNQLPFGAQPKKPNPFAKPGGEDHGDEGLNPEAE